MEEFIFEYETMHKIYEGQYLNGERKGKGEEYDQSTYYSIFKGEYLNGKRNGKGKR